MNEEKLYVAGLRDGVPDIHDLKRAMDDCFEGAALGTNKGYKTFHVGTDDECSNVFDILDAIRANSWYQKFNQPLEILLIRDIALHIINLKIDPYEYLESVRKTNSPDKLWAHEVAVQIVRDINKKHAEVQDDSEEQRLYLRNTMEARGISNNRPG